MKTVFIRNGLILGILCVIIFGIVRVFFADDFLFSSGVVNIALFPMVFVFFAFLSTWQITKKQRKINFRNAFRLSYLTQLIGGAFFMLFLYIFLNWINPESIELLRNKLVENLSQVEKTTEDTSYLINSFKSDYFFSGQFLFLVFLCPIMLPFYGVTSLIIALFFRNK